jgi:hypothetical protein
MKNWQARGLQVSLQNRPHASAKTSLLWVVNKPATPMAQSLPGMAVLQLPQQVTKRVCTIQTLTLPTKPSLP